MTVIFPGGSRSLERYYADAVAPRASRAPARRGGEGDRRVAGPARCACSKWVRTAAHASPASVLPASRTDYLFTDIGFVPRLGAQAFRRLSMGRLIRIRHRTGPRQPGIVPGSFDLVVAADVLVRHGRSGPDVVPPARLPGRRGPPAFLEVVTREFVREHRVRPVERVVAIHRHGRASAVAAPGPRSMGGAPGGVWVPRRRLVRLFARRPRR
jgi:hypothetical protein